MVREQRQSEYSRVGMEKQKAVRPGFNRGSRVAPQVGESENDAESKGTQHTD